MWVLNKSKTLEFPKCVVSLVTIIKGISKPKLFHKQHEFVFEEGAFLSPCAVTHVAVASVVSVCTCIIQACASVINRNNSSPVFHVLSITWHPPAVHVTIVEELRVVALVLYKLLTGSPVEPCQPPCSWWSKNRSLCHQTLAATSRLHFHDLQLSPQHRPCQSCYNRLWKV